MKSRIATYAFVAVLLCSLLTGNCFSCPLLKPAPKDNHSCCPHSGKKPVQNEKKDCGSELYFSQGFSASDFSKAGDVVVAAAAVPVVDVEAVAAQVFVSVDFATDPPFFDLYLRNSNLLI